MIFYVLTTLRRCHAKTSWGHYKEERKERWHISATTDKANILNNQFQSVYSPKSPFSLKSLAQRTLQDLCYLDTNLPFKASPFPRMPDINVSIEGIEKLLKNLNPHKA